MCQRMMSDTALVVDIGNTNVVCAIYEKGEIKWTVRLSSDRSRTADEYFALFSSLSGTYDLNRIAYIALGSVVPELTRIFRHMLQKYFQAKVYEINALSPLGIKFKVDDPSFIGADLIANAFGAWKQYDQSAIVIDMGTATTVQVMNKSGVFEGAIIASGLKTGAANLFAKAAQLNELELLRPHVLLGTNTRDAVLSGVINGHALMLEALIAKLKLQYFDLAPFVTILTGGMADLLKPLTPSVDMVVKNLTVDGFYLALESLIKDN